MDTPIITAEKLTKSEALNSNIPYRQAVGSLNYLATCTRPDIAYAVNYVSRGMQILQIWTGLLSNESSDIFKGLEKLELFTRREDLTSYLVFLMQAMPRKPKF